MCCSFGGIPYKYNDSDWAHNKTQIHLGRQYLDIENFVNKIKIDIDSRLWMTHNNWHIQMRRAYMSLECWKSSRKTIYI